MISLDHTETLRRAFMPVSYPRNNHGHCTQRKTEATQLGEMLRAENSPAADLFDALVAFYLEHQDP